MAIHALKYLHDHYKLKVYLFLVGGGEMFSEIKNELTNLNLNEYVILAGTQRDVKPFYYAANIFSLTSDRIETFSIAALEAMACGVPCVLTDIGGANEMIKNGENVFLSEVSVKSIADNWFKALNTNFSSESIQKTVQEKFNKSIMVNKYLSIFKS